VARESIGGALIEHAERVRTQMIHSQARLSRSITHWFRSWSFHWTWNRPLL